MGVLLVARQYSGSSPPDQSSTSPVIWLPVLAVLGVVLLIGVGAWFRKRRMAAAAANAPQGATTTVTESPTAAVAARRRRNRRRASQMSTKSLPEYAEEARDEEVVLVSRQPDLPTVHESVIRPSMDSGETEHVGTPLLERDAHAMPFSNAGLSPSEVRLDGSSSLQYPSTVDLTDIRGEAPAYFEVIGHDEPAREQPAATAPQLPAAVAADSDPSTHNRRQSFFHGLFSRNGERTSPTSPETQQAASRHRPSSSITSLRPSLSLYRTRSSETMDTQQSQGQIQLQTISAPLPHTLVRTSISRYPATAEQIKFLSSRESLGRFGLPYGEEARADPPSFERSVASASRTSLHLLGHGRSASSSSTLNILQAAGPAQPTILSPDLRVTDSSPPDSPSSELGRRVDDAADSETPRPILPSISTSLSSAMPLRNPRRMSTIQSAVEPESLPTSPGAQSVQHPHPATIVAANTTSIAA